MESEDSDSMSSQRREQSQQPRNQHKVFVIPSAKNKLRACEKCRLIKTEQQWQADGKCENCREFKGAEEYKKYTSSKFEHMVSIIDPAQSWIRRKLMLKKNIVSGVYAVNLL